MKNKVDNEQLILEAAEREFLDKGFKNASTTAIAERAGVTQAMVHYYYRTKEKLFNKVFQIKVLKAAGSFEAALCDSGIFEDVIRNFIEKHFDFVAENPQLMNFVYNEITSNADSRKLVLEVMEPKVKPILGHLAKLIDDEVKKGTIRQIKIIDLMMNIASINLISVMALPMMKELIPNQPDEVYVNFLKERKESNVQFILNALKVLKK